MLGAGMDRTSPISTDAGRPRRVLLLDDDARFRRALIPQLEARGVEVREAQRARDADVILASQVIDLVVVDGLLPDESGIDWIVQRRERGGSLAIVFCSAFFRDLTTFKRLTMELGVLGVRHKPVDPDVFADDLVGLMPRPHAEPTCRRRRSSSDAILFLAEDQDPSPTCPAIPTILVADDDPAMVGYLASIAHDLLLNLVGATDAESARAAAVAHSVDAALVGVPFGEPDGASALIAGLRLHDPDLPVGVISLEGDFPSRRRAAALDAYRMLTHPVDADAFSRIAWELETSRCGAPLRVALMPSADPDEELLAGLAATGADVQRVVDFDTLFEFVRPDAVVLAGGLYDREVCSMVRASDSCGDAAIVLAEARSPGAATIAGADLCLNTLRPEERADAVLAHARRVCRRRRAAHVDYLTRLPRRPAIVHALRARLAAAHREGHTFSLALVDMADLARINRDHGRIAGDRALSVVGRLLASRLRAEDLLGRWAGDRFLIGFVGADAGVPQHVLGRILPELAEMPMTVGGEALRLAFHHGVAHYPDCGETLRELLAHAHEDLTARRTRA